MAMRPTWMSPSICAVSPTMSSFFERIFPLNFPSMRIVSSNSSSPLKEEPRSRKPLSSPDFLFITFSAECRIQNAFCISSPSPHQIIDHANQLVLTPESYVNHPAAPPPVDVHFRPQSPLQLLLRVARE